MKCKSCKRVIDDDSIYCKWCGEKQIRERKKKDEISVPKPRQLASGRWNIQLRNIGWSTTEDTAEECIIKAKAVRAGMLETQKNAPALTLGKAEANYIDKRRNTLSPSTLRGYDCIQRTRFIDYAERDIHAIDWQAAVNAEAAECSAKTLKNAWGFISAVLSENGITPPGVTLPQVVKKDEPWLDYEQIGVFLAAVKGKPCELGALLALHSLRRSEIYGLTADKIDLKRGIIHVQGAAVMDSNGEIVRKDTNKNQSSRRDVPIMIPRLREILPAAMSAAGDNPLVNVRINKLYEHINTVCRKAGLPQVGVHGLRRSFASLAYHLGWSELDTMSVGGWSDFGTMRKIYTKLSEADKQQAVEKMQGFYAQKL